MQTSEVYEGFGSLLLQGEYFRIEYERLEKMARAPLKLLAYYYGFGKLLKMASSTARRAFGPTPFT